MKMEIMDGTILEKNIIKIEMQVNMKYTQIILLIQKS